MSEKAKLEMRGRAIAAMGCVTPTDEFNEFSVKTPSLRGTTQPYLVKRDDETEAVVCNCLQFEEQSSVDKDFKCEHIFAVNNYFRNLFERKGEK